MKRTDSNELSSEPLHARQGTYDPIPHMTNKHNVKKYFRRKENANTIEPKIVGPSQKLYLEDCCLYFFLRCPQERVEPRGFHF